MIVTGLFGALETGVFKWVRSPVHAMPSLVAAHFCVRMPCATAPHAASNRDDAKLGPPLNELVCVSCGTQGWFFAGCFFMLVVMVRCLRRWIHIAHPCLAS